MRPIIIDTNAYSSYKCGDPMMVEIIQHTKTIGISTIVIGELLAGFEYGKKSDQNRKELQLFLESSRIVIYAVTVDTANIYANLRKKGTPIPTNDLWIAAQAIENGAAICTFDNHFKKIDGLLSGHRLSDFIL